jgi:hypothetical protein
MKPPRAFKQAVQGMTTRKRHLDLPPKAHPLPELAEPDRAAVEVVAVVAVVAVEAEVGVVAAEEVVVVAVAGGDESKSNPCIAKAYTQGDGLRNGGWLNVACIMPMGHDCGVTHRHDTAV